MKWFRLSLVSRQFIILGLIVALLWIDSQPVPGPDGRFVCVSIDYPNQIPFPRAKPIKKGSILTIHVFLGTPTKDTPVITLRGIPITESYTQEPNEILKKLCDHLPSLRRVPLIHKRLKRERIFYFGLLPDERAILENAKRNDHQLLFVPEADPVYE